MNNRSKMALSPPPPGAAKGGGLSPNMGTASPGGPRGGSHTSVAPADETDKFTNPKQLDFLVDMMSPGKFGKRVGGGLGGTFKPAQHGNDDFVSDPVLIADFVQKMDEHVKLLLLFMMFLGTLIWAVFFYWWYHLPNELFAYNEIRGIFLPKTYWSGVYALIACPIVAGIYCLFVVVYPDPRKWRFCIRPRRTMRWLPFIFLLIYGMIVKAYWFYHLFLIPSDLKLRMEKEIKASLNTPQNTFPKEWTFIHNYYQCCGMENKLNWRNKFMPKEDIPFPYKGCAEAEMKFRYGVKNSNVTPGATCPVTAAQSSVISTYGLLWPASCCNNVTAGCTLLPTNSQIWRGRCHTSETSLAICVIAIAMLLSIAIDILGIFAFFKTRILETVALRQKLSAPEPHF